MTRSRAVALSLACVLLAGGAAPVAACQDPPPVAPPPLEAAKTIDRSQAYLDVCAAFGKSEWERTVAAARPILDGPARDRTFAWTLYMVSVAEGRLERFEACVADADLYLCVMKEGAFPGQNLTQHVRRERAHALVSLGRAGEAATACREFLADYPADEAALYLDAALAATRFEGRTAVDADYRGKYESDPRLAEARGRIEAALPLAVARLRTRVGEPERALPEVMVHVRDAQGFHDNALMCSVVVAVGGRRITVILVPAEHLVTRCLDLVTGLAHEIVHCRRRTSDHAPDGSSRRVGPLWLEEGLAHWLSDVDAEDIPGLLEGAAGSSSATARAFAAAIAGTGTLENAAPDLQQAAGALLFWDLEQRVGREKVQALARTLLDGGEWSAALAGLDHRAPEEILRSLRDRAETLLAALMPGREEFGRLVALDASEKGAEALAKADAFLAAFPTSPRRGRAEFYRGHALFLLGRYDEALDQLHAVLRRESDGDVASVAEFWIVMIAEQREEWETVVRDGTGYLRDYVFAPANYRKRTQASVDAASEWITFLRPTPKKR